MKKYILSIGILFTVIALSYNNCSRGFNTSTVNGDPSQKLIENANEFRALGSLPYKCWFFSVPFRVGETYVHVSYGVDPKAEQCASPSTGTFEYIEKVTSNYLCTEKDSRMLEVGVTREIGRTIRECEREPDEMKPCSDQLGKTRSHGEVFTDIQKSNLEKMKDCLPPKVGTYKVQVNLATLSVCENGVVRELEPTKEEITQVWDNCTNPGEPENPSASTVVGVPAQPPSSCLASGQTCGEIVIECGWGHSSDGCSKCCGQGHDQHSQPCPNGDGGQNIWIYTCK